MFSRWIWGIFNIQIQSDRGHKLMSFKQDNYSTVGGDGGSRVSEVQADTTSPRPEHKGFMLQ